MDDIILTQRLQLIPLDRNQLEMIQQDMETLEKSLNLP
jgi:hypothetical protein